MLLTALTSCGGEAPESTRSDTQTGSQVAIQVEMQFTQSFATQGGAVQTPHGSVLLRLHSRLTCPLLRQYQQLLGCLRVWKARGFR